MQLLVVNLTGSMLAYSALRTRTVESEAVIAIPAKAAVDVLYGRRNFALSNLDYCDDSSNEKLQELSGHASSKSYRCSLRRPIALGSLVQLLRTGDDCPWRIYRTKVDKRQTIFIIPKRDLSSFLSGLPNSLSLADVCLPGTHDTMAFYGWPVSQCQSAATPLPVQLMQGIRFFDIRLAVIKGKLIAYHGAYPQRTTFQAILADLYAFLSAPATCGETIVVSIKQEDLGGDFSRRVRTEIEAGPGGIGMWFLENRIPTLGEVRGRAIMFSRFGGNGSDWEGGLEGLGIHPTTWPDSAKEGFEWWCKDTFVRTHDWYRLPSFLDIPEKTALSESMLIPSLESPAPKTLSIAFFSAASPLALPPVVAIGWGWPSLGFGMEGVNSRLARFLLAHLGQAELSRREGRTGANDMPLCAWTFLDFYLEPAGVGVVPLLVECNFHGR